MQSLDKQKKESGLITFKSLAPQEGQRLVAAFVWLIEQDKKQNPAIYERKGVKND